MKFGRISAAVACVLIVLSSFQQKPAFDLKASITRGREVYDNYCVSCHMDKGEGIETVYPPLAKSDYLMADKSRSIAIIMKGLVGPIKVNGVDYNGEMTGMNLTDEKVSDVLNYIRNSFGNEGEAVKPEEVKALRN